MEVPQNVIEDLYRRIDELDRRVRQLENNPAPTVPIYNSANWPLDAVEGQVVIAPIV